MRRWANHEAVGDELTEGKGVPMSKMWSRKTAVAVAAIAAVLSQVLLGTSKAFALDHYYPAQRTNVVAEIPQPQASWVPWDNFRITSADKCAQRRAYLIKTYKLHSTAIKCQRFSTPTCPSTSYWLIMVDADQAAPRVRQESPEDLVAPACS